MSWEMTKLEDLGVSLSTKMTLQQAGADRTPDRNSPASRREVNAEAGGFRGILAFCGVAPASRLQSSSGGEGGPSSGTLQPPVQQQWGGRPEFLAWLAGASVGRRSQF